MCGTALLLCSCSLGEESASRETVSLTLVSFEESRELTEQVNLFNETHEGYRIDILIYEQDYADKDDRIKRLQREIAAGRILATDEVVYAGFLVSEGFGTVIKPSSLVLAISANSKHKDISWEFISQFLASGYQDERLNRCLPLRRDTMEHMLEEGSMVTAEDDRLYGSYWLQRERECK